MVNNFTVPEVIAIDLLLCLSSERYVVWLVFIWNKSNQYLHLVRLSYVKSMRDNHTKFAREDGLGIVVVNLYVTCDVTLVWE